MRVATLEEHLDNIISDLPNHTDVDNWLIEDLKAWRERWKEERPMLGSCSKCRVATPYPVIYCGECGE